MDCARRQLRTENPSRSCTHCSIASPTRACRRPDRQHDTCSIIIDSHVGARVSGRRAGHSRRLVTLSDRGRCESLAGLQLRLLGRVRRTQPRHELEVEAARAVTKQKGTDAWQPRRTLIGMCVAQSAARVDVRHLSGEADRSVCCQITLDFVLKIHAVVAADPRPALRARR